MMFNKLSLINYESSILKKYSPLLLISAVSASASCRQFIITPISYTSVKLKSLPYTIWKSLRHNDYCRTYLKWRTKKSTPYINNLLPKYLLNLQLLLDSFVVNAKWSLSGLPAFNLCQPFCEQVKCLLMLATFHQFHIKLSLFIHNLKISRQLSTE